MIISLSLVALAMLSLVGLCQLLWGWRFARQYAKARSAPAQGAWPRVAVLLPVRGADPSLADCLRGLIAQNYPDYRVFVILDSREDPAWNLVTSIAESSGTGLVQVRILETRRATCSLKLSALLQMVEELDDSYGVAALIDADVIPHRDWLRDLVAPLRDPEIGAASGIRWFSPLPSGSWGTLVRYLWNVAASAYMVALRIPWGGSLAFRLDALKRSELLGQWSRSLFEDTAVYRAMRKIGLRVAFVPAATMVNRESIDLRSCWHFMRRQMLDVHLYHPAGMWILALSTFSACSMALVPVFLVVALVQGLWSEAAWLGGGLALYAMEMVLLVTWIGGRVQRFTLPPGDRVPSLSLQMLLALPLTQVIYLLCHLSACYLRKIEWRGVAYEFRGPLEVRMVEYRPYRGGETDEGTSLV